jgi:adenylate cyclase
MEENARTKEQLKRFLPPAVVAGMMEDRIELDRSPRELTATVLFSDIRGFTSLSENTPPPDLIRLLNDYFDRMVEAVFAHGGVLDKFIGDALMAVWGTLEPEDDGGARRAVNAARALLAGLEEFNRSRPEGLPLRMGIGVNTGPVVAGFMGAWNRRLEFTVVGDTVNVASRLCSRAAAGEIVIGPETWRLLGRPEDAVPSEGVRLKGKAEPLPVYTIRHPGE